MSSYIILERQYTVSNKTVCRNERKITFISFLCINKISERNVLRSKCHGHDQEQTKVVLC